MNDQHNPNKTWHENFTIIDCENIRVNIKSKIDTKTTPFINLFKDSILYRYRKCLRNRRENITIRF